jgi:hypothetical protein
MVTFYAAFRGFASSTRSLSVVLSESSAPCDDECLLSMLRFEALLPRFAVRDLSIVGGI